MNRHLNSAQVKLLTTLALLYQGCRSFEFTGLSQHAATGLGGMMGWPSFKIAMREIAIEVNVLHAKGHYVIDQAMIEGKKRIFV